MMSCYSKAKYGEKLWLGSRVMLLLRFRVVLKKVLWMILLEVD
jgi:hypothetical protein